MTNGRGTIQFHQIGLAGLLKQYRLYVPRNQREYAWTRKEVTTLLQDLANSITAGEEEYFLAQSSRFHVRERARGC